MDSLFIRLLCPPNFAISHDELGHMGVGKTYNCILRHFFWPRVKKSIAGYIKTCHTCQLTGKLNQTIKMAPLYPIPAISQPFEHLIIDCVGPLPCSRSGVMFVDGYVSEHQIPCCISITHAYSKITGACSQSVHLHLRYT